MAEIARILIGQTSAGQDSFESVLVSPLGEKTWRLERSAIMADGIAKGDAIYIEEGGRRFGVVEDGGFHAVQIYYRRPIELADIRSIEQLLQEVGGEVDAHAKRAIAVSVPKSAPLAVVSELLNSHPEFGRGFEWRFSKPV